MQVKIEEGLNQNNPIVQLPACNFHDNQAKLEEGSDLQTNRQIRTRIKSTMKTKLGVNRNLLNAKRPLKLDKRIVRRISHKIFQNINGLNSKYYLSGQQVKTQLYEPQEDYNSSSQHIDLHSINISRIQNLATVLNIKLSLRILLKAVKQINIFKQKILKGKETFKHQKFVKRAVTGLLDYKIPQNQMIEAIIMSLQIDMHPFYTSQCIEHESNLIALNVQKDINSNYSTRTLSLSLHKKDKNCCLDEDKQELNCNCASSQDMPLELPIKTEESLFMSFEHSPNDWTETESRYNKHD